MTAISPGDEVTVTITGTVTGKLQSGLVNVTTPAGDQYEWINPGPDVKVTLLRPDRPTRREVLEQHKPDLYGPNPVGCSCGEPTAAIWVQNAGWRKYFDHLDAVLTKWEEN